MQTKFKHILFKEVSIAPLVVFRIIFGALMLFGVLRFMVKGWVNELYINPEFHFTYLGFSWVKPLGDFWMYLPFVVMLIASFGIILGAFYRLATILFFLCFTYVELLDKSYYLNHYYFVSLVAFLMVLVPANRNFSIDVLRNPKLFTIKTAAWTIWIIRFQLGVVYFFAGVAKLNADWLFEAQPLRIWLQAYRDLPIVGSFFASSLVAYFFSWFGCVYDLTIPFFLSFSKTRPIAYFFVIVFHLVTWLLFPIGVFPWVMIFSTLIFFSPTFHEKLICKLSSLFKKKQALNEEFELKQTRFISYFIALYVFFQVVIPFRYLLYPTNIYWTEEGFRFSWRVMLMHKEGSATFYIKDKESKGEIEIDNRKYLTATQIDQMATQPDFILQYAQYLQQKFKDTVLIYGSQKIHLKNPSVHAESFVSLNGRMSRKFVDKKHDLTQIAYNYKTRLWVEPF